MTVWMSSDSIMGLVIASAWKATIVLGVAGFCVAVLMKGRGSAAMRHLVWACATGAILALPLATWTAPVWAPDDLGFQTQTNAVDVPQLELWNGVSDGGSVETDARGADHALRGASGPSVETGRMLPRPGMVLTGLYLLIAALFALSILVGHWHIQRLAKKCAKVRDESWNNLLTEQKARLGIRKSVTLLGGAQTASPLIWGILRPTILLPANAQNWTEAERRMVLTHELSHVKRFDCLIQTMAALACSIYWFHPGVWYAARRLRVEREMACDDQVLDIGLRPSTYARLLVETSRALGSANAITPVALSMATQLEARMKGILDMNRSRRGTSRLLVGIALAASACVLFPIGGVHEASGAGLPTFGRPDEMESGTPAHVVVQSVAARPGERLIARIGTKAHLKVSGWSADSVQVRIEHIGSNHEDVSFDFATSSSGVQLTLPDFSSAGSQEWTVELFVPARYNLQLETAGGGISVGDVSGSLEAMTADGPVRLERFRGAMDVTAARGSFEMYDSDIAGEFRTDKGSALSGRLTGNYRSSPWSDETGSLTQPK